MGCKQLCNASFALISIKISHFEKWKHYNVGFEKIDYRKTIITITYSLSSKYKKFGQPDSSKLLASLSFYGTKSFASFS